MITNQTFACPQCNNILSYNTNEEYLFSCSNCGKRFQIDNGKLLVRKDLQPAKSNLPQQPYKHKRGADIWKLVIAFFGAIVIVTLIAIVTSNKTNKSQSNENKAVVDSTALVNKPINTPHKTIDSATNKPGQAFDSNAEQQATTTADDKVQSIAELVTTSSDENFNTVLNITISNPYNKPLSNVQIFINPDGNSYIPDDLPENSWQLVNIDLDSLQSGKQKSISVTTKDKGAKNVIYAINTRKIRFADGTLITK